MLLSKNSLSFKVKKENTTKEQPAKAPRTYATEISMKDMVESANTSGVSEAPKLKAVYASSIAAGLSALKSVGS